MFMYVSDVSVWAGGQRNRLKGNYKCPAAHPSASSVLFCTTTAAAAAAAAADSSSFICINRLKFLSKNTLLNGKFDLQVSRSRSRSAASNRLETMGSMLLLIELVTESLGNLNKLRVSYSGYCFNKENFGPPFLFSGLSSFYYMRFHGHLDTDEISSTQKTVSQHVMVS